MQHMNKVNWQQPPSQYYTNLFISGGIQIRLELQSQDQANFRLTNARTQTKKIELEVNHYSFASLSGFKFLFLEKMKDNFQYYWEAVEMGVKYSKKMSPVTIWFKRKTHQEIRLWMESNYYSMSKDLWRKATD